MRYIFHERFSELINQSDLTYEEIAKKLGLKSKSNISKYASGQIQFHILSLERIVNEDSGGLICIIL